ncbi:patatin-like phospholipase family protein [Draconibacterium sp.]
MKQKSLLLIIIAVISGLQINAQSVGVVLSGGGAKGMAHIGVIRILEENNIPIDYIAGTSIGAIVGGLYAAGYSTDQMEKLFKSDDFYFWSTGKIQKDHRYFFKMPEENPSWINMRIEKKDEKIRLLPQTHLIPEEQMDFAFMELMAATNTACKNNFDSLMVPFFCVATDVNKSQPAILRTGDLGNAIRASMTVPFYFKPIEIDGNLMFDGGIVNNFPQDIMSELYEPDIIIGHKVTNEKKVADATDVMAQISNIVMRPTDFSIAEGKGIVLETHFDNIGLLDFNKIDMAIVAGMKTTYASIDSIKRMVKRRVPKEIVDNKRQQFNAKKHELYFQNIQVEGVKDPMQRKYIIQSIKGQYDVISLSELKKEYFKLIADDHIKSIVPISRYNKETGYFDLHLKVEPQKKLEVTAGGNISTKPINQGFASFNYRTYNSRAYALTSNIYFGRFYSSFKLGARIDYPTTLPFYLEGYTTFNRWDFFASSSELFFEDVRPPYIIQNENNTRFEAGIPAGLHSKFYGGIAFSNSTDQYYQTDIFNKADEPDKTTFNSFSTVLGIENYSFNYKQFPTEGVHRYITLKYINGKESNTPGTTSPKETRVKNANHDYFLIQAHSTRFFNFGSRFTLGLKGEAAFSNKDAFSNFRSTKLNAPGFYPTPHSKTLFIENFHSNNYFAAGLNTIFHLVPNLNLRLEAYTFLPINEELPKTADYQPPSKFIENYYLQGLAALVYNTAVGPLSLSLNYYEKPDTQVYFLLNFGYIMFNKRGF